MIRDDICGSADPARPQPKRVPWQPLLLLAILGLVAAHWAGWTKPLAGLAMEYGLISKPPAMRLVGDWESEDDPMFRRVCRVTPEKSWHDAGVYSGNDDRGMRGVIYRVLSEDRSGRNLLMAEFVMGANQNLQVKYTVAEDGKSMTREYDHDGKRVCSHYRYVGPPSQGAPYELPGQPPF